MCKLPISFLMTRPLRAMAHFSVLTLTAGSMVWPCVSVAQQVLPSYAISTKLKPVTGFLGLSQESQAVALNNAGQVVGWTTKSAGSVSFAGFDASLWSYLGLPIGQPGTTTIKLAEVSPVIWTGGVPKVQPRYQGNRSSWGYRIRGDGAVLVAAATKSGRLPRAYGENFQYDLAADTGLTNSTVQWLKGGTYSPIGLTGTMSNLVYASKSGEVLVAYVSTSLGTELRWFKGGRTQRIFAPPGVGSLYPRAVNNAGTVLLMADITQPDAMKRCFTWSEGVLTELRPPESGWSINCLDLNDAGQVAGVFSRRLAMPVRAYDLEQSVFMHSDGTYATTPFGIRAGIGPLADVMLNNQGHVMFDSGSEPVGEFEWLEKGWSLFANGGVVSLGSLMAPSLPAGQHLKVLDFNDQGQALAYQWGAAGTPLVIVSPVRK